MPNMPEHPEPATRTGGRADHPSVEELQDALGSEFEVKRRVGEGAMAAVYLATETGLDRPVALKVLRASSAHDETARARFEREAKSSASLAHRNVVQVYRFGRLPDDTPYLVMRYVKGRTMAERIDAEGRLELGTARKTLHQVASALAAAHAKGIIHRDVRPANVLWDQENQEALLSDFGIAAIQAPTGEQAGRLTQTGQMLGTPRYLSPEQLQDQPLTEMVDIYAFGVMGYEMITGEGPYNATSHAQILSAHLRDEPRPLASLRPEVDTELADLLARCLSKDPKRRPRASDIALRLGRPAGSAAPVSATPGLNPSAPIDGHADLQELIKRRVPQIVLIALGVGWGTMTLVDQLVDRGILGDIVYRLTLPLVVCGVAASTVIGWFHGEKGKQDSSVLEWILLSMIAAIWIAISSWILISN